jgi:hypothetical protein
MFSYLAYGLHLVSELELPELLPYAEETPAADVTILRKNLSPLPLEVENPGLWISFLEEGIRLDWVEVGAFFVREGREIIVSPHAGVSEEIVRLPLLGVVLGILLHQRGQLTLHASAVSVRGTAVAFVGEKGAGKSTMAAAMQRRGHALLTDDVLAVDPETHRVEPAYPQLKLRGDAAEALQTDESGLVRLAPDLEKYALRQVSFERASRPLRAVFVLGEGRSIQCRPLDEMDAFLTLMEQGYASRFLGTDGTPPTDFQHYAALAAAIPVVQLQRPRDLHQLSTVCEVVERHLETHPNVRLQRSVQESETR